MEKQFVQNNRDAWNADAYASWVKQYGTPARAGAKIIANPRYVLRRILPYISDPHGLQIANPLGSHGRRATALALLGADVCVFDISQSNARYAQELSAVVGVDLRYVVGDFIDMAGEHTLSYDIVVMELGILHYFIDLGEFVCAVRKLMKPNALLVLNEFHPLLQKSITISTDDIACTGGYFDAEIHESPTPYAPYSKRTIPACFVRRWNLGEIVTAFAVGGLRIVTLTEHPSKELAQLPGTFTLVASLS